MKAKEFEEIMNYKKPLAQCISAEWCKEFNAGYRQALLRNQNIEWKKSDIKMLEQRLIQNMNVPSMFARTLGADYFYEQILFELYKLEEK